MKSEEVCLNEIWYQNKCVEHNIDTTINQLESFAERVAIKQDSGIPLDIAREEAYKNE